MAPHCCRRVSFRLCLDCSNTWVAVHKGQTTTWRAAKSPSDPLQAHRNVHSPPVIHMIALDRSDFWTFARMDAVLKTSKNGKGEDRTDLVREAVEREITRQEKAREKSKIV
jgi:hypothetical protein